VEAHRLQAGVDAAHVLVEAGAEGQGMEDDVGELLHGHDHDHGRDDAPWLPSDRVHARPREEGSVEGPWEYEALFPVLFPSPCLCLCPDPGHGHGPCLYLARGHGPCLPCQGQGQGQTKEQELQRMNLAQLRVHEVCYSHDHALFLYQTVAEEAAAVVSSTSPALRRLLAVRPNVGEREGLERAPRVG
jgi:hypothetical protein